MILCIWTQTLNAIKNSIRIHLPILECLSEKNYIDVFWNFWSFEPQGVFKWLLLGLWSMWHEVPYLATSLGDRYFLIWKLGRAVATDAMSLRGDHLRGLLVERLEITRAQWIWAMLIISAYSCTKWPLAALYMLVIDLRAGIPIPLVPCLLFWPSVSIHTEVVLMTLLCNSSSC